MPVDHNIPNRNLDVPVLVHMPMYQGIPNRHADVHNFRPKRPRWAPQAPYHHPGSDGPCLMQCPRPGLLNQHRAPMLPIGGQRLEAVTKCALMDPPPLLQVRNKDIWDRRDSVCMW